MYNMEKFSPLINRLYVELSRFLNNNDSILKLDFCL